MENTTTSLGQFRVGITFNPSGNERVNSIKQKAADLIDQLENERPIIKPDAIMSDEQARLRNEINRLISLAQTHIEDAAMWGVKAVTKS